MKKLIAVFVFMSVIYYADLKVCYATPVSMEKLSRLEAARAQYEKNRDRPWAILAYAGWLISCERQEEALRLIEENRFRFRDSSELELYRIKALSSLGRFEEAAKVVESLMNERYFKKACQAFINGLTLAGFPDAKRLEAIKALTSLEIKTPEIISEIARLLISQRKIEEARSLLARAEKEYPAEPRIGMIMAELLMREGKYAEAARLSEQAARALPSEPYPLVILAVAREKMGDEKGALGAYREIPARARGNNNYLNMLAIYLICSKRYEEALEYTSRLLQEKPLEVNHNVIAGIAAFEAGDFARAESLFRRALSLKPSFARVKAFLADVLFEQGKEEEAERLYEEALELDEPETQSLIEPTWPCHNVVMANSLIKLGRFEEAAKRWKKAIAYSQANNPGYHLWTTASVIYDEEAFDRAFRVFFAMLLSNSGDRKWVEAAGVRFSRVSLCYAAGDWSSAIENASKIEGIEKDTYSLLSLLGALMVSEKKEEILKTLELFPDRNYPGAKYYRALLNLSNPEIAGKELEELARVTSIKNFESLLFCYAALEILMEMDGKGVVTVDRSLFSGAEDWLIKNSAKGEFMAMASLILSEVFEWRGDIHKADTYFIKYLDADPAMNLLVRYYLIKPYIPAL